MAYIEGCITCKRERVTLRKLGSVRICTHCFKALSVGTELKLNQGGTIQYKEGKINVNQITDHQEA